MGATDPKTLTTGVTDPKIVGRVDFVNFQIPKTLSAKKLWHDMVIQKIFM